MKAINTNDRGKYSTAVYHVAVGNTRPYSDLVKHLELAFGGVLGRSQAIFGLVQPYEDEAHFSLLVNNETQTTSEDVARRLRAYGFNGVEVKVVAAVPERGCRPHAGSPRAGTTRVNRNGRGDAKTVGASI